MVKNKKTVTILAVDCCEHALKALKQLNYDVLLHPQDKDSLSVDLIVTGVTQFPIRRSVISELRRLYPSVPALILRRESKVASSGKEQIRGDFMLSDQGTGIDLEVVRSVRSIFPIPACEHTRRRTNSSLAQDALKVIIDKYSDTSLDLAWVARQLVVSPKKLSRVLNQEAGMSFRQLLRNIRVEEAKRLLSSGDYSIKEIAAHVGFSDGHYFSRSFKELTGQSASEFRDSSSLPR